MVKTAEKQDVKPSERLAAEILAENLQGLMNITPALDTQVKLAAKSGVAQTSISLMLGPERRMTGKAGKPGSPKLSQIEAVAKAFGLEAWQMLIDPATFGETIAQALHRPATTDARLAERGIVRKRVAKTS